MRRTVHEEGLSSSLGVAPSCRIVHGFRFQLIERPGLTNGFVDGV